MLKVILNRLKYQAEEIIAEEQAGFRAGRNTPEQISNLRIMCIKYLQHQQNLYHVFIDFKSAFDRVWQAALSATTRKYNISANLIEPGHVAQSVGHLTRKSGVLGSIPGLATHFCFSFRFFQEGQLSVYGESMWTKYWSTA